MENLEQAAERYKNQVGNEPSTELEQEISKLGFIDGAKWMAREMYTSEEVKEILIRFKSDVITQHHAQVTNINPYTWFKDFIKNEENQGRFVGYTKDDMFMWAGYCAGRRMMNPTDDVEGIFEDWERKHKETSDVR